ncbi:hypothetical protein DSO57_1014219 [Entomophthora muscae]|uniref:Uncharacterized protein n=1 Tax=Entomophthora muscae TaxID=34485 RepID=A0ACC2SUA3_9FUNG|nr:hypothetical protein DSO57_1014219 [Entomophthora muscae]
MNEIPTAHPLPNAPPAQDFSKLGFVYITVLGLANQVVSHTGSWCPLATAINYLVCIAPIVYMAFQARPAFLVGVQLDSGMGRDNIPIHSAKWESIKLVLMNREEYDKRVKFIIARTSENDDFSSAKYLSVHLKQLCGTFRNERVRTQVSHSL